MPYKNPTDKAASHQEKLVLKDTHADKTSPKNQQHQNQYDRFLLVHSLLLPLHQYELRIALGDDGCESDIEHQQKSFQQNYQQHRYPMILITILIKSPLAFNLWFDFLLVCIKDTAT